MSLDDIVNLFTNSMRTLLPDVLFEKSSTPIFAASGIFVAGYMLALWGLNFFIHDPTFVDAAWGLGFVGIAFVSMIYSGLSARSSLLFFLTAVWGIRLSVYLYRRWRSHGPDQRYVQLLRRLGGNYHVSTLIAVFGMQAIFMWVVSLPLQAASLNPASALTLVNMLGALAMFAGTIIESVADYQMARFRQEPANKDKVMNSGLWQYTRHPNYFGDALVWWGCFFLSFDSLSHLWAVVGPITMTYLLRFVSGVPTIENKLKRTKPAYNKYVEDTSAFVPFPKSGESSDLHQRPVVGTRG